MIDEAAVETRRAIPLFGLGNQQRSPFISTVERINCVVEMAENGRQQAAILGLPGLTTFVDFGDLPARGVFSTDNDLTFYVITGDQIVRAAFNQPPVTIGILQTQEGPVWMDSNGRQLFINDGTDAFIYEFSTSVLTQVEDPDFPEGARGGIFLSNRFWVSSPDGRVFASALLDGLAWDGLDFFTPESVPDGIRAIARWFNDLVVFGTDSIEFWTGSNTGVIGGLGFRPIAGANTEVGLEAELGYAATDQTLFFMGNSNGQTGIYEIAGYGARKVSTPHIDDLLAKRTTHVTAVATAYTVGGHPIFQLTLPGASSDVAITIVYDNLSKLWSFRQSYELPYYRGLFATRSTDSVYVTDAFVGKIHKMVEDVYTEDGDIFPFEVTGFHLLKEGDSLAMSEISVDIETGLGIPVGQGDNPQGMLQISKDGGHAWWSEAWVLLGKIGEYKRRAIRRRIGAARDIAVRFRITDPIPRRVTGAYVRLVAGQS
jgi:hypothetical protein